MLCPHCGTDSAKNIRFCTECGRALPELEPGDKRDSEVQRLVGFSPRIQDPAFTRYLKNTKRWSWLFSAILAAIAIFGFYIYGETSPEMDNPEALYIGLGIGGMFLLIALVSNVGRSRSETWDGVVVDKRIEQKRRKKGDRKIGYYWEDYVLYAVVIESERKTMHSRSVEDDDTVFNYFQIGDKVRHHGGLNSLEKFDKSGDSIIFCNACASLNDIRSESCFRCHCPLLK